MSETMRQTAPYPADLADLVTRCGYRPAWRVVLRDETRDHTDPADDASAELAGGLTLTITTRGYDTYNVDRGESYGVRHLFVVPAATYTRASWCRWLFDRFLDVERHEAMEFFTIESNCYETDDPCRECGHLATVHDGRDSSCGDCGEGIAHRFVNANPQRTRPYGPNHGPGHDPYTVREVAADEDRRTSFRGVVHPS